MARQRGRPWAGFIPTAFSLLALILVVVVIFGGVNNSLTSIYYLETDLSGLKISSALEGSTFLQDLSEVSGADFIGPSATAASLGLANSYTISLLTSCGHFPNGNTVCSPAHLGFSFQPLTDLKLAATSLAVTLSPDFLNAVNAYAGTSHFLAFAYLSSALLSLVAPPMSYCSGALAAGASSLATLLLLVASIAAAVVFRNLSNSFNTSLNAVGMHSATGSIPIAISFIAAVLSLVASVVLIIRARKTGGAAPGYRRNNRAVVAQNVGGKDGAGLLGGADGDDGRTGGETRGANGKKKMGFWGSLPSLTGHKYVQIEKQQPVLVRTDAAGQEHDDLMPGHGRQGYRGDEDDTWATQDDYSHTPSRRDGSPHGSPSGRGDEARIPMISLGGKKGSMDVNTAYEPYTAPPS